MCNWTSELRTRYRCRVPVMPGREECVLHSPEKTEPAFRVELRRQMAQTGRAETRNPPFDFTGYRFPLGICTNTSVGSAHRITLPSHVPGDLILTEAVVAGRACLEDLEVDGDVDCEKIKTDERFYATRCCIHGDLNLRGAWIGGTLHIGAGVISGDLLLRAMRTQADLYLFGLHVEGDAYLHEVVVGGTVDLDRARISGCLDASFAQVGARWSSRGAHIGGMVDCSSSHFDGAFMFSGATAMDASSFQHARFGALADFQSTSFHRSVDFEGAHFNGPVDFTACQAHGVQTGQNRPTTNPFAPYRRGLSLRDGSSASTFWRFARLAYESTGDNAKADASYYYERASRAQALLSRKAGVWAYVRYFADLVVLRVMLGYGTSIVRTIASWIAIQLAFGVAYALVPGLLSRPTYPVWSVAHWVDALCFSSATFAAFGLGVSAPTSLAGRSLVTAEAALGCLAYAAIVVILMRKLMR